MSIDDLQTVTSLRSQIKNEQKSFELKNDRNVITNSDLNQLSKSTFISNLYCRMTCWMWLLALISRAKQSTEFGWIFSLPPFTISWVSQLLQAYSHPGDSSYSLGWAQLPWHSVPSQWWCPHCYWKPIEKRLELICRQSSTWKHLKPCELHIIWILKRILRSIEALTPQTCFPGQVPLCQGIKPDFCL